MTQSVAAKIAAIIATPFLAFSAFAAPGIQNPVACTMEAKQCPDGSYVGRTGPSCAFAACPTSPPSCVALSRDLYLGARDAVTAGQVSQLQAFLAAQGYLSQSSVIGVFGPLTLRAVQSFQRDNGVNATGYVGVQTRAHIQAKGCSPYTPPVSTVNVYSVSPQSGQVGTHVSITGFGFTQDNTIHFGSGVIVHVPISSSIAIACTTDPNCRGGIRQTLEFDVPASLNPACYYSNPRCLIVSRQTQPGDYQVSLENTNGTSNAVTFTVTGNSGNPAINSLSPSSGPVGRTVTVYGSGFTPSMTLRFAEGAVAHTTSNDGTSMTFTVPQSVGPYCLPNMMCAMYLRQVTPGTYDVYVQNTDGTIVSNKVQFTVTSGNSGGTFSITGLDAPTTLALGQQGTWTVHVSVPDSTGQLHYSVVWGDEVNAMGQIMSPAPQQIQTSATFSHAYQRSGMYTAIFTVTDDNGHSATVSSTITVTPLY